MKQLIFEVILTIILTVFGYLFTVYKLSDQKFSSLKPGAFVPRGRNRWLYIAVSLLAGISLGVLFYLLYPNAGLWHQMKLLTLVLLLVPAAAIDHRRSIIPNGLILTAVALRLVFAGIELMLNTSAALEIMKSAALGAAVVGVFFLIVSLVVKNSIGMGDVKLFFVMGLFHGFWGAANAVFFSLLVAFFHAVFLLLTKRKKRKDVIALAPHILLGTWIAIALTGM